MKPLASIEHRLPRRTRLKLPSKVGDRAFFAQLTEALQNDPQINGVSTNSAVGSLTLVHSAEVRVQDLASIRDSLQITDQPSNILPRSSTRHSDPISRANTISAGLIGLSAIQVLRGQITGNASENLWNAFRAHAHLKNRWLTLGLLGLGAVQVSRGRILNSATSLLVYALTLRALEREAAGEARGMDALTPSRARSDGSAVLEDQVSFEERDDAGRSDLPINP